MGCGAREGQQGYSKCDGKISWSHPEHMIYGDQTVDRRTGKQMNGHTTQRSRGRTESILSVESSRKGVQKVRRNKKLAARSSSGRRIA